MSDRKVNAVKLLDALTDILEDQEKAVVKKAMGEIRSKTLTPELAVQLWYEINALRKIPTAIQKQGRSIARSADEKPVDTLNP